MTGSQKITMLALRGRPARWVRVMLGVLTLAPVAVVPLLSEPKPLGMPPPIVLVVLVTLMAVLAVAADVFRPWTPPCSGRLLRP